MILTKSCIGVILSCFYWIAESFEPRRGFHTLCIEVTAESLDKEAEVQQSKTSAQRTAEHLHLLRMLCFGQGLY